MGTPAVRHESVESRLAFAREDPRLQRLRDIVNDRSLLRGEFTLSSGRKSNYLFQLRQTTMHPEGASLIGELVVEFMRQHGIKCVGGLELGAVPVVSAIAVMSHGLKYPVDAFFVRKQAKEHGARERIDGQIADDAEILIVDDVATTGGSILKTVDALGGRRDNIRTALCVVDREEGAAENLNEHGIQFFTLLKRSDFQL